MIPQTFNFDCAEVRDLPHPFPHSGKREMLALLNDERRSKKPVARRTVDYHSSCALDIQHRAFERTGLDSRVVQNHAAFNIEVKPPAASPTFDLQQIPCRYIHTSVNKQRSPINTLCWLPGGRRLVTGAHSGEFTIWNGYTFNFERVEQAHDTSTRAMAWTHDEQWMVSGDHDGVVKIWNLCMKNVRTLSAHQEAIRDLSFSPTSMKLATGGDDASVRVFDFARLEKDNTLIGHGWDVKTLDWHPTKSLIASGSKDNLIKLWDPRAGDCLSTFHAHKNHVNSVKWHKEGHWLLSCSKDQLIKLHDIRMMKEVEQYRKHTRDVNSITWHPTLNNVFASGGCNGEIYFWHTGNEEPDYQLPSAHESNVLCMAFHPLGHILVSGSQDTCTKFWGRFKPGEDIKVPRETAKFQYSSIGVNDGSEIMEVPAPDLSSDMDYLPGLGLENAPGPVLTRKPEQRQPQQKPLNKPPPSMPQNRSNFNFNQPPPMLAPPMAMPQFRFPQQPGGPPSMGNHPNMQSMPPPMNQPPGGYRHGPPPPNPNQYNSMQQMPPPGHERNRGPYQGGSRGMPPQQPGGYDQYNNYQQPYYY